MPTAADPLIGRELMSGQFRILERIGAGGMGIVYTALQPEMNRKVAVKVLNPKLSARKDLASRLRREARAMSQMSHPSIAKVFLHGELEDGSLYVVMELLEGQNLKEALRTEGPFSVERALPILLAADAVILVGGQRGEREIRATDFFVEYRKTALAEDELILQVRIPLPAGRSLRFRKVGTRRAQAISKVVMALAWHDLGTAGWTDVRVALGSVAATPIRARATEAVLEGARPSPEVADRAAETLAGELEPIDDVRSTADYRRVVSARILHRLLRDAEGW